MNLPKDSILVVEDIDTDNILHKRNVKPQLENTPIINLQKTTNLSEVLNSLDGIVSNPGRILIATTNHKEKLDEALLRDGRFDLKVEISFVDQDIAIQFFHKFYPDFNVPCAFSVRNAIPMSELQSYFFEKPNAPQDVFDKIRL